MTHDPKPPLDDDERELARRLARLDAGSAPSADLDARVLALAAGARPAQRRPSVRTGGTRRRWALGLGMAASVVLAAGLALQLRPPGPDTDGYADRPWADQADPPAAFPAPPPAGNANDGAEFESANSADATGPAPVPAQAATEPGAPGGGQRTRETMPARVIGQQAAPAAAASMTGADRETARPATGSTGNAVADPMAPTPAPPPAAPRPARGTVAPIAAPAAPEAKAAARAESGPMEPELAPPPAGPSRQDAGERAARPAASTTHDEEPFDEAPPASADSPAVRRAWLERIRELVLAGEAEAARASLQEFRRRYPAATIPEDLREFLP